jgi:hypothetical protein
MPASESASKFALPKSLAPENLFGVARGVRPTTEPNHLGGGPKAVAISKKPESTVTNAKPAVFADGVRGEEGAALVAFFDVLEARVQHFFDTAELGAPEVAHVVETLVDCSESRVEKRHYDASQRRVKQHRDADGKIELLVGHQS